MKTLITTIQPRSAFGGPIRGDTLFGQLCWTALHRWGEKRLGRLLEGYIDGSPFLVVSDAFPTGYLPRPALPLHRYDEVPGVDRKAVRKRAWLPRKHFGAPLKQWLRHAVAEQDIDEQGLGETHSQPHNTINRMTGTTGKADFAPYVLPRHWYAPGSRLDLYLAVDESRIEADELCMLLRDVGAFGHGRDASIGLGKFDIESGAATEWPSQPRADTWMTLAPCAPQGMGFRPERCWYRPFTRFGRHGDRAMHSGRPFKTPVLMADTAALLQPADFTTAVHCGQGLGGDGSLSRAIAATVHQGYAPVLGVRMEETT